MDPTKEPWKSMDLTIDKPEFKAMMARFREEQAKKEEAAREGEKSLISRQAQRQREEAEEEEARRRSATGPNGQRKNKRVKKDTSIDGPRGSDGPAGDSAAAAAPQDEPYTLFSWAREWLQEPTMPLDEVDVMELKDLLKKTNKRAEALRKRQAAVISEAGRIRANVQQIEGALATHYNLREQQHQGLLPYFPVRRPHTKM
ncbi:hypothetical protein LQW54_005802 [Pestalotiopsis sp. IQ-011]